MIVGHIIPAAGWLAGYRKSYLKHDLAAGVTVAVMLVPQSMGYALLAGLPPVFGLYASTVPLVLYAFFGSSRHLAVGPVAIVSLLVFSTASAIDAPGSARYLQAVLVMAIISGAMLVLLGLLRAGFIVNFISDAVIVGFTSAAVLIIGVSQSGNLIGISLENKGFLPQVMSLFRQFPEWHPATAIVSISCILFLVAVKKKFPRIPGAMAVTVIVTLITALSGLDKTGVAVLGTVPGGMPRFSVPEIDFSMAARLLPAGAALVFVGFMESIAIARSLADRGGYQVHPNKELIGLGLANIGAGLFSGYPVTGGLSRTAVNYASGAKTPLASLVTVGIILLTLLLLTPLFYFLPKAVLASVIIVAVAGLVELRAWHRLFTVKFTDGSIAAITFLTTLLAGIEYGILTGITSSLIVFIWNASRPDIAELGYVKEERAYLNIKRYPHAHTFPGVLIVRIDGPFFFANTGFIKDYIRSAVALKKDVTEVIINMSGVDSADAVSLHSFGKFVGEYALRGIRFRLVEMKGAVRDLFIKAKWEKCCGQKIEYKSLQTVMFDIQLKHENLPIGS